MPIPEISYVLVISWYGLTCGNLIPATASWVRAQNVRISVSGDGAASLNEALVLAVVVVRVVLLAGTPVTAGDQLGDRDALFAGEVAADFAHRRRLAGYPDPGAVRDVCFAGGCCELFAESVAGAPVVPGNGRLGGAAEFDLVIGAVDLDVRVDRDRLRERLEERADGRDRRLVGGKPPVVCRRL